MRSAAVCIAFVLTYTSGSFVAGLRYIDPQAGSNGDIGDKRLDLAEPSCDELRAMWRYTKRQNRAAKTTSGYPMYPFNPNIWPRTTMFPDRIKLSRGYTRGKALRFPSAGELFGKFRRSPSPPPSVRDRESERERGGGGDDFLKRKMGNSAKVPRTDFGFGFHRYCRSYTTEIARGVGR